VAQQPLSAGLTMPGRAPAPDPEWPPAYQSQATDPDTGEIAFPPGWAPSAATLDYLQKAITVALLLLALPYLLGRLARNPGGLARDLGRKHTGA